MGAELAARQVIEPPAIQQETVGGGVVNRGEEDRQPCHFPLRDVDEGEVPFPPWRICLLIGLEGRCEGQPAARSRRRVV